jgi:hypothetical protein
MPHFSLVIPSPLHPFNPLIIHRQLRVPKILPSRQLYMYIRRHRHTELDILPHQLQYMPPNRSVSVNEMQMLPRHRKPLPILRASEPYHRRVDVSVLIHKLCLPQLGERLPSVGLALDRAGFDVREHACDAVDDEEIRGVRRKRDQLAVDGGFGFERDGFGGLGHEVRGYAEGDLRRGWGDSCQSRGLELVDGAVEGEEFAVHAREGAQAVGAFAEEFGGGNSRCGNAGH